MIRDRERYEKRVGTVIDGRWRVDSLLGRGSTAAVYAATHRNGHRATLKILHPALCAEPATIERFLREAGIANAIKHRAIVPIGDDGTTEDGCAYLVLELFDGETLEEIRERAAAELPPALREPHGLPDEAGEDREEVQPRGPIHARAQGVHGVGKPEEETEGGDDERQAVHSAGSATVSGGPELGKWGGGAWSQANASS